MQTLLLAISAALAVALLNGSAPPIGIIDYYGLKAFSREQLQEALQIGEGDPPPSTKEEAIARLKKVPGVKKAHLAIVCCSEQLHAGACCHRRVARQAASSSLDGSSLDASALSAPSRDCGWPPRKKYACSSARLETLKCL